MQGTFSSSPLVAFIYDVTGLLGRKEAGKGRSCPGHTRVSRRVEGSYKALKEEGSSALPTSYMEGSPSPSCWRELDL